MAVSDKTAEQVARVLTRHMKGVTTDDRKANAKRLVYELMNIKGNKSYRMSLVAIRSHLDKE